MRGLHAQPASPDPTSTTLLADDDGHLVAAAKADPREFAPLYSRYVDPVYRYCFRRLGHPEAAADATSQVFAKALAALPTYRDDAKSFRSWLFAIAHNVLVDESRARRWTCNLDEAVNIASADLDPEALVLADEVESTIHGLLARLSPDQRQVMELRLAGLTGPEIAIIVGRSPGSIKVAQFRAVEHMRTALGVAIDPGKEAHRDQR